MTDRREFVLEMTDHERIAALTRLGHDYPDVFDEVVRQDTERQRAIRAHRERIAQDRRPEDGTVERGTP